MTGPSNRTCVRCETPLAPDARYCHRCGIPAGGDGAPARAMTKQSDLLPWAVGGAALLALLAMLAARGVLGDGARATPAGDLSAAVNPARAVDISRLSPEERADRLYNRVMTLATQGKRDSIAFFAPMAIEAYALVAPLNEDQHYDVGRIAEVAGALPLAKAQADSILARSPNHLLGLILAARVAELEGNDAARRQYERRLLAAQPAELGKRLPEYERHGDELVAAIAAAQARGR